MTSIDQNKEVAVGFWNRVFAGRDPAGAVAEFVGGAYTQHNPDTPDGPEAFIKEMTQFLRRAPELRAEIKRVVAEGDLVIIHNHITSGAGDRGLAGFDLFRLRDGKIIEHWDARQPVPERAALLLREVAGLSAEEVAAALGTTTAAVKSALQRARATLDALRPTADQIVEPDSPAAREMLARYIAAFETSDLTRLEEVLRDDAAIEVVPARGWFAGRITCLRYLARVLDAPGSWQMTPTSAHGQPAAIACHRGAAFGLGMLDVTPTGISRIVAFGDSRLVKRFDR